MAGQVVWSPSAERVTKSQMDRFRIYCNERFGLFCDSYEDQYKFSLEQTAEFWQAVGDYCGIIWQQTPQRAFGPPPAGKIRGATWFEGGKLNFAENLLLESSKKEPALVGYAEGADRREISQDELRLLVGRCAAALKEAGVKKGDRVAGVMSNTIEAIVAMLATTSLGGVWSSCSPDFGTRGIVDRLGQITPKVVFYTGAYQYGGKRFCTHEVMQEAFAELGSCARVEVNHLDGEVMGGSLEFGAFINRAPLLEFAPCEFSDPLYIMFSSGTTGVPKCIVHSIGGTLIQHKKELMLHSNLDQSGKLLYFTTCGWMMWNWMVSALACDTTVVLFEGSPGYPDMQALWQIVKDEGVTALGTSPKFVSACMQAEVSPKTMAVTGLETVLSTGAPLMPEHFDWIYKQLGDVHLASICGGTDIISCFMLGVPTLPVRRGEIQYPGLGMAVHAFNDEGESVIGEKAELVCTQPFPSMPVGFWRDNDGSKYHDAYFGYFGNIADEVWRHGDYVERTPSGGVIVYGRSDATLNPGGVRIGTAEIYRQVELIPGIVDSLAIGRRTADDTEVVLFVKLGGSTKLSDALIKEIKNKIRQTLTPRHVPKEVIAVNDIPYTRSGKKVELAVTKAVHGEEVKNLDALVNPEAMQEYFRMGGQT